MAAPDGGDEAWDCTGRPSMPTAGWPGCPRRDPPWRSHADGRRPRGNPRRRQPVPCAAEGHRPSRRRADTPRRPALEHGLCGRTTTPRRAVGDAVTSHLPGIGVVVASRFFCAHRHPLAGAASTISSTRLRPPRRPQHPRDRPVGMQTRASSTSTTPAVLPLPPGCRCASRGGPYVEADYAPYTVSPEPPPPSLPAFSRAAPGRPRPRGRVRDAPGRASIVSALAPATTSACYSADTSAEVGKPSPPRSQGGPTARTVAELANAHRLEMAAPVRGSATQWDRRHRLRPIFRLRVRRRAASADRGCFELCRDGGPKSRFHCILPETEAAGCAPATHSCLPRSLLAGRDGPAGITTY